MILIVIKRSHIYEKLVIFSKIIDIRKKIGSVGLAYYIKDQITYVGKISKKSFTIVRIIGKQILKKIYI